MSRGPAWFPPLVAIAALALALTQTIEGLGVTGAFGWRVAPVHVVVPAAYQQVDREIERLDLAASPKVVRDPFLFPRVAATTASLPSRPRPRSAPLPTPPAPVLTAIVWDNDPRALVRWNGREWTVREGGLFDEFQVMRISREQVTLRRGDATLVLHRRNLGE